MTFSDQMIYHILRGLLLCLGKIPLHAGKFISQILGGLWFALDKKHQKITMDNLLMAYGRELSYNKCKQLGRDVFSNSLRMIFEYAWFYNSDPGSRSAHFNVKGLLHLEKAHAKGKGILVLTAHLGNWELSLALLPISGFPATAVYRPIKSVPFDRVVRENRASIGVKLFALHNAFKGIKKGLEQGELIGLLMDQNTGYSRGVFVDFFGRKACANPGLAKLAMDTGAPVVPVFVYRENDTFVIEVQPELPVIRTGDDQKDIQANTQLHNRTIEKIVRRYPEQWFWLHKRWKTRPPEES